MFGRKKKEQKLSIEHPVLGKIIIDSFLHTATSYEISLFGKKYVFFLYLNSPESKETNTFTSNQEKAIDYFDNHRVAIEKKLENQLKCFFECDDYNNFLESISLENFTISSNGKLVAFFSSEFSDEDLTKEKSNAYFTDTFGIVIYPEEQILYNAEACYKFDS